MQYIRSFLKYKTFSIMVIQEIVLDYTITKIMTNINLNICESFVFYKHFVSDCEIRIIVNGQETLTFQLNITDH